MPATSGSPTQLATSVATLADLAGVPDDAFKNGDFAYVESSRATYQLDREAVSGDVATFSGNGRWIFFQASKIWESQATWYIDPVNGNDENTGATSTTALKTWAEFVRRVRTISVATTVTILSNIAESLVATFNSGSDSASLIISGQPTVIASGGGVGHSTFTDPVPATNTRGLVVVDNLVATGGTPVNLSSYAGKMIRCPATDVNGEYVAPILRASGNDANVPWFARVSFNNAKPSNGSLVEVLELVTCPTVQITAFGLPVQARYLRLTATTARLTPMITNGLSLDTFSASPIFFGAWFASIFTNITFALAPGIRSVVIGCLFANASTTFLYTNGGRVTIVGGGCNATFQVSNAGIVSFQGFVIDGGKLQIGSSSRVAANVFVECNSTAEPIGVFASPTNAIEIQAGASLRTTTLFGSGSTGYGLTVNTGGQVFISTGTPTITGTSGDLQLNGAATAIPPLTAGAAVPAASALTTWAQWAAAPFNRNVTSYTNGSAITGS